jgi:hypothetical protein
MISPALRDLHSHQPEWFSGGAETNREYHADHDGNSPFRVRAVSIATIPRPESTASVGRGTQAAQPSTPRPANGMVGRLGRTYSAAARRRGFRPRVRSPSERASRTVSGHSGAPSTCSAYGCRKCHPLCSRLPAQPSAQRVGGDRSTFRKSSPHRGIKGRVDLSMRPVM